MADPAFMQKLVLEQMITISSSLVYEAKVRGDRFWQELDLVAANVVCLSAANAALVYLVAPTRAAPAPARFAWQNILSKLPNNVFEATTPLREYTTSSRAAALLTKSAELCGVGMLAGAAQSGLAQAAVAVRRRSDPAFQPSMPIPSVQQSALGFAAAQGIFANLRYQVRACGLRDVARGGTPAVLCCVRARLLLPALRCCLLAPFTALTPPPCLYPLAPPCLSPVDCGGH
jgi:hypothetical protein